MNLITTAQHNDIRSALQDVVDTFFTTSVTYRLHGEEFADGEMMHIDKPYAQYTLLALPKYYSGEGSGSNLEETTAGAQDVQTVDLLLGYDNLVAQGLIDVPNNKPIFTPEVDEFILNGETFKVTVSVVEGNFQPAGVLVRVRGRKRIKRR